jgi:ethanolamine ammonia-lyase small subunit
MNDLRPTEPETPPWLAAIRSRTPARILVGRAGTAYPTATQLALRADQAAAADAVHAEMELERDLGIDFVERFGLVTVTTQAGSKVEHLARPERGRRFSTDAVATLRRHCQAGCDLLIAIGDGLSANAVTAQVPHLLPLLVDGAVARGWTLARPFAVRYCRVGLLNEIGELLDPGVAVLLIGERPGLATAQSLSAYLAYRPRHGHCDAQRNLISNIHDRGVAPTEAANRILALAEQMRVRQLSGVSLKE